MNGDVWELGDAYEAYVGRWSRRVAAEFVRWLDVPSGLRWLDAGCGTGALTSAILTIGAAHPTSVGGTDAPASVGGTGHPPDTGDTNSTNDLAGPRWVVGVDPSPGFLRSAPSTAKRVVGDAAALPLHDGSFGVIVSGLALNFVPRPERAIAEFARVAAPGATVAAYVWDYTTGMRMMRYFWDVAAQVVPAAAERDEGPRFPICREPALRAAWGEAGLTEVTTRAIEIPTVFTGFDDFWRPFLGGQGASPAYLATLGADEQAAIRERLRSALPTQPDGSIALTASAWAVRGRKPEQGGP